MRTVQLREIGSRWGRPARARAGPESVALEVPGADPSSPGLLEATFDPGCRLGEWDFQMLGIAAHLGALVLEIERLRGCSWRAPVCSTATGSGATARRR